MRLKVDLTNENGSLWISSSKLGGFLHLYFFATVVLVMDLCVNRSDAEETTRKEEIREAIETLEKAKKQSVAANMFLNSLMTALRKHSIRIRGHHGEDEQSSSSISRGENRSSPRVDYNSYATSEKQVDQAFSDIDFEVIWQSFMNSGVNNDPNSWNPLLNELELCMQGIEEQ